MSAGVPIQQTGIAAPTPQNTPLTHAPIAAGLSRPTVPAISEADDEGADADADDDDGGLANAPIGAVRSALASLVQGKLNTLVGKSSGYVESLPVEVKRSLEGILGVQVKQNELQNQYKRECLELEKKYLGLQQPLYDRRHAILTGASAPTAEEVAAGEAESLKEDPEYQSLPESTTSPTATAIPEFWLTALRNHVGLAEIITDRDAGALKHLIDIRLSYLTSAGTDEEKEKPGFKLSFVFEKNAFFENEVLEKTYVYQPEVGYSGDFVYDRAIGCEIKWKEDKDLTKEFEIKKQRNKNTNRTRLVRKAHPTESFFNFFNPPVMPSEEALEAGEIDDDELEEIEERLEVDYQIGEDIKERIIPRAVDFFTGKNLEFEDADEDEDDYEDLDDEDGFEDEDDESESEGDATVRRRGPPKGRGAGGAQNSNADECKQQ